MQAPDQPDIGIAYACSHLVPHILLRLTKHVAHENLNLNTYAGRDFCAKLLFVEGVRIHESSRTDRLDGRLTDRSIVWGIPKLDTNKCNAGSSSANPLPA